MRINDIVLKEKLRLIGLLDALQKQYNKGEFPEGRLVFSNTGTHYKYYISSDKKRNYIPFEKRDLVKELALKRYYEDRISAYQKEIKALDHYLANSPKDPDDLYRKHPALLALLPEEISTCENIIEWDEAGCDKNKDHPENLIIQTLKGDRVRSKSEAMIADELFRSKIPYIYEKKLVVGTETFSSDFTVMNKRTGQVYIWEHFGKMNDPKYVENNCIYKMNKYLRAGYVPGINFITTYEDIKNPFYPVKATKMIDMYLR